MTKKRYRLLSILLAVAVFFPDLGIRMQAAGVGQSQADSEPSIALQASVMRQMAGGSIDFTVTCVSQGNAGITDMTVQATIPDSMAFVTAQNGGLSAGDTIRWSIGRLAAGASARLTFTLRVKAEVDAVTYAFVTAEAATRDSAAAERSTVWLMLYQPGITVAHTPYLQGYPQGELRPEVPVTRAEAAAMLARIQGLEGAGTGEMLFRDVPEGFWAADYIEATAAAGIFTGYADGTFRPQRCITRAELAEAIAKCRNLDAATAAVAPVLQLSGFTDIRGHWAEHSIEALFRYGIVDDDSGTFAPEGSVTRAETVRMLNRMCYRGPLRTTLQSHADVPAQAWYCGEIEEAMSSHESIYAADGTEILE